MPLFLLILISGSKFYCIRPSPATLWNGGFLISISEHTFVPHIIDIGAISKLIMIIIPPVIILVRLYDEFPPPSSPLQAKGKDPMNKHIIDKTPTSFDEIQSYLRILVPQVYFFSINPSNLRFLVVRISLSLRYIPLRCKFVQCSPAV